MWDMSATAAAVDVVARAELLSDMAAADADSFVNDSNPNDVDDVADVERFFFVVMGEELRFMEVEAKEAGSE